jgi:hypothetical protein
MSKVSFNMTMAVDGSCIRVVEAPKVTHLRYRVVK